VGRKNSSNSITQSQKQEDPGEALEPVFVFCLAFI